MSTMKSFAVIAVSTALLSLASPAPARAQSLIQTNANVIAYSEGPVPGLPPEQYFAYAFDWPAFADDGSVVFRAQMEGGTITALNSRAYFRGTTAADLQMLTRMADPAPGLPGLTIGNGTGSNGLSSTFARSPDGRTFWGSYVAGPGVTATSNTALFGGDPAAPALVAREGDAAPGTAGAAYNTDFSQIGGQFTQINHTGTVLYTSKLVGGDTSTSNDSGLFYGPLATPGMLVRKGDILLPGLTVTSVGTYVVEMDNDGRVVFDACVSGAGVTTANDCGIWLYTPGLGFSSLIREGDPAPGTAGASFGDSDGNWGAGYSVNDFTRSGKFLFTADLVGGDAIPGNNDRAVYIGSTGGTMTLLGRSGDPAPGTDGTFLGFSPFFSHVNDSGQFVLQAQIVGGTSDATNNNGYWTGPAGGGPLVKIVRTGDPAPGTPGAVFDSLIAWQDMFSDHGRLVFFGTIRDGDVDPDLNNENVLYAWDTVNGVYLLGRGNDTVPATPDVSLYPWTFAFTTYNNTDGRALGLSKDDHLALVLQLLPQGQAIVTLDLNCYPPSTWYADTDGDGYGDLNAPLSVCHNATAPAGYVQNSTDCDDTNPSVHPGAVEVCNGLDDNCDGTIDNATIPSATMSSLRVRTVSGTTLVSWTGITGATGYDVLGGGLNELRTAHGAWATLTQASCLSNDLAGTSLNAGNTPPPVGDGRFYLVRPMNCGGSGTYDEGVPSQTTSRDAGIQAGGYACP